jgi:hypothetical protein
MNTKQHWDSIYSTKPPQALSWFQPHARSSLRLIRGAAPDRNAAIIDVGGGASTLVDDLLNDGYANVSVLDLSGAALRAAAARLGVRGESVRWFEADVTTACLPPAHYDAWHDRAVFHFLTSPSDRAAYVRTVTAATKPGATVIVASFAEDGPTECSGLPVVRYGPAALHAEFGEPFELLHHEREEHWTPAGKAQHFVYCLCRRTGSDATRGSAKRSTSSSN